MHNLGRDANLLSNFVGPLPETPWPGSMRSFPIVGVEVTPALVIVLFSNDVTFGDTTLWGNDLLELAIAWDGTPTCS